MKKRYLGALFVLILLLTLPGFTAYADGEEASGIMPPAQGGGRRSGWYTYDGYRYYFRPNSGTMVTGFQYIGGNWYYFRESGTMATGEQYIKGNWYFFRKGSGTMARDWQYINGVWKYYDDSGIRIIHARKSLDRNYDWYMDQQYTGPYADGNCGPTSGAMVLKWLNPSSRVTGRSARNEFPLGGRWWYTSTMTNFLDKHNVRHYKSQYQSPWTIRRLLDQGRLVVSCINMTYIHHNPEALNGSLYGKYFPVHNGGHFVVIMGYQDGPDQLYFEVFDSASMGYTYSDGTPVGKYRLYSARDMEKAILNHWNGLISIPRQ